VIGGTTKAAGGFTDLTVSGNTTLGDSAADTVTVTGALSATSAAAEVVTVIRDLDVNSVGASGVNINMGAKIGTTPTLGASITGVLESATAGFLSLRTRGSSGIKEAMRLSSAGAVTIPGSLSVGNTGTDSIYKAVISQSTSLGLKIDSSAGVEQAAVVNLKSSNVIWLLGANALDNLGEFAIIDMTATATKRLTISLAGAVTIPGPLSVGSLNGGPLAGFRNRIINGGFDVWQRGTSVTLTANLPAYTADQFRVYSAGAGVSILKDTVSFNTPHAAIIGVASNTLCNAGFTIESANIDDLAEGPVTFSYEIYSNTARLVGYNSVYFNTKDSGLSTFTGGPGNGSLLTTALSTWQKVSVSIASLPAGFKNGGYFEANLGAVTAGQTVRVRNFQLEPGTVATPFENIDANTRLGQCRRFYRVYSTAQNVADLAYEMRATPTQAGAGPYTYSVEL